MKALPRKLIAARVRVFGYSSVCSAGRVLGFRSINRSFDRSIDLSINQSTWRESIFDHSLRVWRVSDRRTFVISNKQSTHHTAKSKYWSIELWLINRVDRLNFGRSKNDFWSAKMQCVRTVRAAASVGNRDAFLNKEGLKSIDQSINRSIDQKVT